MGKTPRFCKSKTKRLKLWPYDEYYIGERDKESRRDGEGENHWTGAESLEWYTGHFIRDTMNGHGNYRWRYLGRDGAFVTYEGQFYANAMHGYGTMSYPDGRVFKGIYHHNVRWGPGVESHTSLQADVGFWRGRQLVRLTWRPATPSVALDLMTGDNGNVAVEPHRILLTSSSTTVGETNSALELLKKQGAEPLWATENWPKLYSKYCSDLESPACHVNVFDKDYYRGQVHTLEETTHIPELINSTSQNSLKEPATKTYFAWNNNQMMLHMMKHCYKHDEQRIANKINLTKLLSGPRKHFRPAGKHERDCRTLLMASYLGHIVNVAQLINEHNVYPDLADIYGNTALMYATCGDQPSIVHFLVEAGADVNSYNDSCCTPLGVALMRYMCAQKNILPNGMMRSLLPPRTMHLISPFDQKVSEWHINRDTAEKALSKSTVNRSSVKLNPSNLGLRRKIEVKVERRKSPEIEYDSDNELCVEKHLYLTIKREYYIKVNNHFAGPMLLNPYIFTVNDMVKEVEAQKFVTKDPLEIKLLKESKIMREHVKPSNAMLWQNNTIDEFTTPASSFDKLRMEMFSKMMLTILQLLADGADPKLVRCPQPALLMAVMAESPDLVRYLVHYGVDVDETFPDTHNYTALEVSISRPITQNNVEVIRALLENGANAKRRLKYHDEPGPTLFHALLARKMQLEFEDDPLRQIFELLLDHHCDPVALFNGRSAIDIIMSTRVEFLDTFIKHPKTDLNAVINSSNQTIFVRMFSQQYYEETLNMDRNSILTNLLLYGADPLIKCQDGEDTYENIFAFAKKTITDMEPKIEAKSKMSMKSRTNMKSKMSIKSKMSMKSLPKSEAKMKRRKSVVNPIVNAQSVIHNDLLDDYKLSVDLVVECARLIHVRWLQAKLLKDLVAIIYKYKYRPWNMIIKEHKEQNGAKFWLTPQRCLEIWDILKKTNKKPYKDDHILKFLLHIVQFYKKNLKQYPLVPVMTAAEKRMIESDVAKLMKEHKMVLKLREGAEIGQGLYVKPELAVKADHKFNICFECALPLKDLTSVVPCTFCNMVSFCSEDCLDWNAERLGCHPCSEYMNRKKFPVSVWHVPYHRFYGTFQNNQAIENRI